MLQHSYLFSDAQKYFQIVGKKILVFYGRKKAEKKCDK